MHHFHTGAPIFPETVRPGNISIKRRVRPFPIRSNGAAGKSKLFHIFLTLSQSSFGTQASRITRRCSHPPRFHFTWNPCFSTQNSGKYAEIFSRMVSFSVDIFLSLNFENIFFFFFPPSARQRIFCVSGSRNVASPPFTLEHFLVWGPKPRVVCEITCRPTHEAKGTRNNRDETRRERQRVELTICQFSHLFHRAALSTRFTPCFDSKCIGFWELWLEISISSPVGSPGEHFTTVLFQVLIWPVFFFGFCGYRADHRPARDWPPLLLRRLHEPKEAERQETMACNDATGGAFFFSFPASPSAGKRKTKSFAVT